jgi:anti-sigma B factor antagonist
VTTSDSIAGHQADLAAAMARIPSDDILTVTSQAGGAGVVTLVVVGEVDMFTASLLRSYIRSQFEGRLRELVLDLSAVEFLGSAGLAALVDAQKLARDRNVGLRLIAATRAVIRPLQVTGLIDLFTVVDTSTRLARSISSAGSAERGDGHRADDGRNHGWAVPGR